MSKYKPIWFNLIIIFLIAIVTAQDAPQPGTSGESNAAQIDQEQANPSITTETEEERLERMLQAFDNPNIQEGIITVSFREDITKEEAIQILEEYNLEIQPGKEQCYTVSVADPGQPITTQQQCYTTDGWSDNLKFAIVIVQQGEEKETAQNIIEHEDIIWVEPRLTATTNQELLLGENSENNKSFQQEETTSYV